MASFDKMVLLDKLKNIHKIMAVIKVLVEGVHEPIEDDKIKIGCTTTLIKSDENVIVDPGAFSNRFKLIEALNKEGLKPEDIKFIILTHSHLDHIMSASLFENAKVFLRFRGETNYPGQFQKISEGYVKRFDILNEEIVKDIKIIETPGHTSDSISIVVDSDEGKVVIAGDAIGSEEWINLDKKPDPNVFYDIEKYEASRKNIIQIADWIVPGHGKMFKVNK